MHSYFSMQTQPHQTSHYVIFVAEVASTCNEMLLTRYLLKTTKDPMMRATVRLFDEMLVELKALL